MKEWINEGMNLRICDESGINECIWDNEETHAGGRGEGKGGGGGGGAGGGRKRQKQNCDRSMRGLPKWVVRILIFCIQYINQ